MEFTTLELTLGGFVLTVIGGLIASRRSRSLEDCDACQNSCRNHLQAQIDKIKKDQDSVDKKFDLIFRMVRSLVIHSEIPKDEQERILNDRERDN